jgi:hypothetical protein
MAKTMIECLIRRPHGTVVTLGEDENEYHFQPNEHGAHVCAVEDSDHAQRLLSIREAYALYEPGAKPGKIKKPAIEEPVDEGFDVQDELVDATDPDETDDLEVEALADPIAASNRAIQRWADNRGLNHRSKTAVADYAMNTFGMELDKSKTALLMTRELIQLEAAAIEDAEV